VKDSNRRKRGNTLQEKVNIKQALRVFDIIRSNGDRTEEGYRFRNLTAFTDFDGYTVTIKNDYVRLDIYFHNKMSFTFTNDKERYSFLETIEKLDKLY
jgi:hypothetical protein